MPQNQSLKRETLVISTLFALFTASGAVICMSDLFFVQVLAMIFSGLLTIQFVLLFHDCMHGSLFEKPELHAVFGRIIGTVFLCPYSFMRHSHLRHHVLAGVNEHDTEILHFTKEMAEKSFFASLMNAVSNSYLAPILHAPLLQLIHFVTLVKEGIAQRKNKKLLNDILIDIALIAVFLAAVIGTLIYFGCFFKVFILAYVVPYLIGLSLTYVATKPLHSLTMSGRIEGVNPQNRHFLVARTIDSNQWMRTVFFNVNYHLEHHFYPQVSRWELGKLAREKRAELLARAEKAGLPVLIEKDYSTWFRRISKIDMRMNPVTSIETLLEFNPAFYSNDIRSTIGSDQATSSYRVYTARSAS